MALHKVPVSFYRFIVRLAFDFGAPGDVSWAKSRLRLRFGDLGPVRTLTPIGQLVKSSISGRTLDVVSWRAFGRIVEAYGRWSDVARAPVDEIESVIAEVTYPDLKAGNLRAALQIVEAARPDFDLAFLGRMRIEEAFAWLERLPGVGRKVSASTLNFSTLHMPAFVIDTHVLRILERFGLVRNKADTRVAYETIMPALDGWGAADLQELHILMKRLGQELCRPSGHDCQHCPISPRCPSALGGPDHSLGPVDDGVLPAIG